VGDTERSQEPVTDEHLARLGRLVSRAHDELKQRRPELAGTLVAGVLAQGAAAHRADPAAGVGVKDLDLWLFYAEREGVRRVQERGRARVYDFGPSSLGRHPDDPATFRGRRVDVLMRTVEAPHGADPADIVRTWLARGTTSPTLLRQRPMILVWPRSRLGEVVWQGGGLPSHTEAHNPPPGPATNATGDNSVGLASQLQSTPLHLADVERLESSGGIPASSGVYAWWAGSGAIPDIEGPPHPVEPGLELLYIGIAPKRAQSASNLRRRVLGKHARGGSGGSTLRRAVAALIGDSQGYRTRRTSRTVLLPEDEERLSGWMRDNLRVTWVEHPQPWTVETALIAELGPPLNQAGNAHHPLHGLVKAARARWRGSAQA